MIRDMRPGPLPPSLNAAFTVGAAKAADVPEKRLRASDLTTPFHGTRATRALSDLERLALLLAQLPEHTFACGITAASVHGMPLPAPLKNSAFGPIRIGVPHPSARVRRPGVIGRAMKIRSDEVVMVRGIRCLSVLRTWVELSTLLPIGRLVAVTDHMISRRAPQCTVEQLTAVHERAGKSAGAKKRQVALALCTPYSESPRESELRTLLILAGLPEPEPNVKIFDGPRFVARVDLLYRAQRLIVEYDGDYHNDPQQWSRDQARRAELEALGYRLTVVTARDFDRPDLLVARIRRLLVASA